MGAGAVSPSPSPRAICSGGKSMSQRSDFSPKSWRWNQATWRSSSAIRATSRVRSATHSGGDATVARAGNMGAFTLPSMSRTQLVTQAPAHRLDAFQ